MAIIRQVQFKNVCVISFVGMLFLLCSVLSLSAAAQEGGASDGAPQELTPADSESSNLDGIAEIFTVDDDFVSDPYVGDAYYEDLVLAVFVKRTRLSSGVFAIQSNGLYYYPVEEMTDALGFDVTVDYASGIITGAESGGAKAFTIDTQTRELNFDGQTRILPEEAFFTADTVVNEVYLQQEVLSEIWPLDFELKLGSLTLFIIPDGKLPFEERLARKERQEKVAARREARGLNNTDEYIEIIKPYALYSPPILDIDVSSGYDGGSDTFEHRFSVGGTSDLAFASADYSLSFAEIDHKFSRPENLRLRFNREDAYEGALPFGLDRAQWGDIRVRNRELVGGDAGGRGAQISSGGDDFDNEFDVITIEGVGTPGWETELYINDQLIDFGVVDDVGEYRFEDIQINFGNNRLRVALYGPQGQLVERVEDYLYQSRMTKAGQFRYNAGVVDAGEDLITIDERDRNEIGGMVANAFGSYGVNDKITAFSSVNRIRDRVRDEEFSRTYFSAGLIASLPTTLAQAEAYKETGGGTAFDLRTLSSFKGVRVNTKTSLFRDFESPKAGRGVNAKDFEFDLDVDDSFSTPIGILALNAGYDYERRKSGRTNTRYDFRQSLSTLGARLTHQSRTQLTDNEHVTTRGKFSTSTRYKDLTLRGALNYTYFPERSFDSMQLELRHKLSSRRRYSQALRFSRNFESKETVVGAQISRDFKKFLGSVEADWSSLNGASIFLRASASLGPYGNDGEYILNSTSLRPVGPVGANIYQDNDYNGIFNEGDEPLPDIQAVVSGRTTRVETDENGRLVDIAPVGEGRTNVSVFKPSIDDPYLVPSIPGYKIYSRPGVMHNLDFPLVQTGAIDGTARWTRMGEPIAGLNLELMNVDAEIVSTAQTAPDGYFTFERIPPGSYTIRANPESGINLPFKYVELTPDDIFKFGMDIDASDFTGQPSNGFDVAVDNSGFLNADNILSIARGFKTKKIKLHKAGYHNAVSPEQAKLMDKKMLSKPAVVQAVRVGEHPDKVRLVLDLSGSTKYSISNDKNSNMIFIDLPYAQWNADKTWTAKAASVVNSYDIEKTDSGVRMLIEVAEGGSVGASGLLKASGNKKDRLYLDIEKN